MTNLYLEIATIPDFELGSRLYKLHDLSEEDISRVMFTKSREKSENSGELDPHMKQLLAISILIHDNDGIKMWSAGGSGFNEASLLKTLQELTDESKMTVVTWDGNRNIFPLLNYRYLSNGVRMPDLASRVELMTKLSSNTGSGAPLNEVAVLSGFPCPGEMPDDQVLDAYLDENVELVIQHLDRNIISLWRLNQRWLLACGNIDQSSLDMEYLKFKNMLLQQGKAHLAEYAESFN